MVKLSGKIAVVTGGTGSLGKVVVDFLLQSEAGVIVTHTGSEQSVAYIAEQKKRYALIHDSIVDLTDEHSVDRFYQMLDSNNSSIDILCNLVGGIHPKKFIEDISIGEWNTVMKLNLQSCFLMTRSAIPRMKRQQFGRIINISAMSAITPEAQKAGYSVSKSAVIALTKVVAEEIKEYGNITANAIAPGIIVTEANKQWGTSDEINKWVTPEQIASMIMLLCSESGGAFNGQIFQMNGKV